MNKVNLLLATITSAVSGAVIGILFAPDKGSRTRKKISTESDEYLRLLKESIEDMRHSLNQQAEEARKEAKEMGEDIKNKGEDIVDEARDKAAYYQEQTKEELKKQARKLNVAGYSEM
ncbi:MAG TPA: YtxH domain-containing protein, partial [Fodinibius sp.]|nr:YtxH domain-containing protein [Fodinibius sp.]